MTVDDSKTAIEEDRRHPKSMSGFHTHAKTHVCEYTYTQIKIHVKKEKKIKKKTRHEQRE